MIERNSHHLLHDRASWEARPEGESIRSKLIAHEMARAAHNLLHLRTAPVPVPLYPSLQFIARQFKPRGDVFNRIDQLTDLFDKANDMKHIKPIEVEVNLLAMDALEAQIPYIQDGLPGATVIDLASRQRGGSN